MHPDLRCSSEAHHRNKKSIKSLNPGRKESKKKGSRILETGKQEARNEVNCLEKAVSGCVLGAVRGGAGGVVWVEVCQRVGRNTSRLCQVVSGVQQMAGAPVRDFCHSDKYQEKQF